MSDDGFNVSDELLKSDGTPNLAEVQKLNPSISIRSLNTQQSLKTCVAVLESATFGEAAHILDIAGSRINKIVIAGKTLYASSRDGNLYAIE